jgi:spore photoproduct lyase
MKNKLITFDQRKTFIIRPSGRSTDFIAPSFGWGCLYDCLYCYMKRNKPEGLSIAANTNSILTAINNHAYFTEVVKPNQTHSEFISYDLSCNEDFALHAKYHDWKMIFDFFKNHPVAFGSFATKYVNKNLLDYNPEKKIRIRFSLMPEKFSELLEPKTSKIIDRIKAIDTFIEAGYDVHINFSPVVVTKGWLYEYANLFKLVNDHVINKNQVKCEVIFLTQNEKKHLINLKKNFKAESLVWHPKIQEDKTSQFGGKNIRYKSELKTAYIKQWMSIHKEIIPWCDIRYIF